MMTLPTPRKLRAFDLALLALALAATVWLGSLALPVNLAAACHWKQWPALERCPDRDALPMEEQVQDLRDHLSNNPGDSLAYADLARFATQPPAVLGSPGLAVVEAASLTAPFDPTVLKLQAGLAMEQSDWATAVSRLVLLSEKYGDAGAHNALAALLSASKTSPELLQALLSAGQSSQKWLLSALRAMPAAGLAASEAAPLVGRLAQVTPLKPDLGQLLIKRLKAEGAWVDAHAIWLRLWNKPLGFLFNGDFEQAFIPDAFDWEILDKAGYKAGAQAGLATRNGKGRTLQVKFTGRTIKSPIVRQDLFLPPGTYLFKGEYQSADLRSQEGLAWVFSCTGNGNGNGNANGGELARSPALNRTGPEWREFSARIKVNKECGSGVALSLQTQAPYESKTGQQGEVRFDHFTLTRGTAHD